MQVRNHRHKTIIMIHGMWGGGWYWNNYVQYFESRGYVCITPTLRYHNIDPGAKPHPLLGTTSLLEYVNDLQLEVDSLGVAPIIMGHSMGGLLAQMLASRIESRALVLLAPAAPYGVMAMSPSVLRAFRSFLTTWGFWKKPHRQTFSEAACSVFNRMPSSEQRALHAKYVYESGRATAEIGLWPLDVRKASAVDETKINCPVLAVVGAEDKIIPPASVRKIAAKYGATYREFPNHAHWVVGEEGWENVAAEVSMWLNRNSRMS